MIILNLHNISCLAVDKKTGTLFAGARTKKSSGYFVHREPVYDGELLAETDLIAELNIENRKGMKKTRSLHFNNARK